MQRKPNSRRRPNLPRNGESDTLDTQTQTFINQTVENNHQHIFQQKTSNNLENSAELHSMQCFPPFFSINSKPKLANFNPLTKQTKHSHLEICPYDLEQLDREILEPGILHAFIKKVQRTQPLYDLDELQTDVENESLADLKGDEEGRGSHFKNSSSTLKHSHGELFLYRNEQSTSGRKMDRIVSLEKFEQFCHTSLSGYPKDAFLEHFRADYDKRTKRDLDRMGRVTEIKKKDCLPWLEYEHDAVRNNKQKPEFEESDEKLWKSSVHSTSRVVASEPTHNLNKVAELFEKHLPQEQVEYLLILLAGVESTQLQKLTDTLKKISILLFQNQEITSEFSNCITPFMKRKLIRIGKSVRKIVESELLTFYDSYLDEIFSGLATKLEKAIDGIAVIGKVVKSKHELVKEKNCGEKVSLSVNRLEIGEGEKEAYYDAYQRLTSFTID